jgi:hypothetical protein
MKEQDKNNPTNPFRVPDNYFDELNERILKNTAGVAPESRSSIRTLLRPYFSLAAVIAGAAILTMAVIELTTGFQGEVNHDEEMFAAGTPQFLIDGMDMYIIEQELFGEHETIVTTTIENKDEIIDYLMLNEVDLSLIYDLLEASPVL